MLVFFIILYMIATMVVGVLASKFINTGDDLVNAGRKLPVFFNAFALFAMWFGAETIFGAAGRFVDQGVIGVIEEPFGATLCLVLFGIIFARPLYRRNILTFADLFRQAYGARVETVSSLFMLCTYVGYIAAQLVALGILLKLLMGTSLIAGILIASCVVTIYTFAGGMWAVSVTDFLQSIMIILGLIFLSVSLVMEIGGFQPLVAQVPDGFFRFLPDPTPEAVNEWVTAWMVVGLGSLASQDVFQRVNCARSETVAVRSTFIGAGMYLFFSAFPLLIGLCVRVLTPERLDGGSVVDFQSIVPEVALAHGNPLVRIFFLGALVSAILSTCSGALLAPSSILAENLLKPLFARNKEERLSTGLVRISVLIMATVSTLLAFNQNDIYRMVGDSGGLGLVSILVPTLFGLFGKRPSSWGAYGSIVGGAVAYYLWDHLDTLFPAWSHLPVSAWIVGPIVSCFCYLSGQALQQHFRRTQP